MENELWIRLRRLQTHPLHLSYRPLILSLLEQGPRDMDWTHFVQMARERECPVETLEEEAKELPEISRLEAKRLQQKGIHLLTPADSLYPTQFRLSVDPPLTLTVKGSLEVFQQEALAVVGSREPGGESLRWMENQLGEFCRLTKAVIVSGGARGIDQKAHSVALRNGCATIVLLPSGIENPYPSEIDRWYPALLDGGGAIVSEYPANTSIRREHFHQRNRLIAAGGLSTLVVEAKIRSGTLITAMRAAEIGRPLLVVPGHPSDPRFGGSLQLLSEGATLVRESEDLALFWQAERSCNSGVGLSIEFDDLRMP